MRASMDGYEMSFSTPISLPSLDAAKELLRDWKYKYNHRRGHSSLGGKSPKQYALTLAVAA
ncbi:MAG: transposase [Myxococcales bacterium]|nr:transposase [Myxococcales bacterium]